MSRLFLIVFFLLTASCSQFAFGEVIFRRDGLPELSGSIYGGVNGGLLFKDDQQETEIYIVPWSSILRIEPEKPRPELQTFLDVGEELWRAKIRLLRGDVALSEPIFASQFLELLGEDGPDARLASEGYLRVLLARGALKQAVIPWLETVRHQELGVESPFNSLEPILHLETMACPHLPVAALSTIELDFFESYTFGNDTIAAALAELLQRRFLQPASGVLLHVDDPLFISQILQATDGSQEAIKKLQSRIETLLPWQQVWAHYSIGVGLLSSSNSVARDMGMLQLAMSSSADSSLQPWLTGAAMIRLSEELTIDGKISQADRVLQEAKRVFPSHPLLIDIEIYRNTIP